MKEIDLQIGWGPFSQNPEGIQQREIYICTFAMLAKFVSSDGEISQKEIQLIDNLMRQTLKLNESRREFVTKVFNLARKSKTDFEEYARRYKVALRDKPKMYEWLIDLLYRASLADEVLAPEELGYLESACKALGVSTEKYNEIKSRYSLPDDMASYAVLSLSPGVSFKEVQLRYEDLLDQYDVERLIEGNFAEEIVELAQKRRAEITAAFLKIKKESKG
ncbi:MAG TPA: TerB family tellurite resistance protein [Oligoflexia bacterium]|nr:TerB family tellurite resistance protein [Oligoflexia bacterium]HMP47768.1 TerB family tellurite resistance protein [Oligoflexia bacterium]